MKKFFTLLLLSIVSFVSLQTFASDDYEHFKTKDGRHICSVFMKNEYKLCSEFGIIYEGDAVTSGNAPFFTAGSTKNVLAVVGGEKFCVANGVEVDAAKCTEKSTQSLEHFKTKDGRHMCSIFMKNEYAPCSDFEIIYEGDKVVSGVEPFFSAGFPDIEIIKVGNETFCVEGSPGVGGFEVDMSKCDGETASSGVGNSANDLQSGAGNANSVSDSGTTSVISYENTDITPKCTVNGKLVDCAVMTDGITSAAKTGLWIFIVVGAVFLLIFIFWLVMFIHVLANPVPDKIIWILLQLFFGIIGAIVYYFVVKRKFINNSQDSLGMGMNR